MTRLPHIDGSGRGMDDGECTKCGVSGSLAGEECPVRLRAALDATRRAVILFCAYAVNLLGDSRECPYCPCLGTHMVSCPVGALIDADGDEEEDAVLDGIVASWRGS